MDTATLQLLLGVSIFAILFSIGVGLTVADFARVLSRPRAFFLILVCQLVLLPALAVAICRVLELSPAVAVGLLLLAACPGGVTSNTFARLAGGDVALSVALTATSSILAVVSIPTILYLGQQLLGAQAQLITIPLDYLAKQLLVITLVPVALGMGLRYFASDFGRALEPRLFRLTAVLFFALIVSLWYLEFPTYRAAFIEAGLPTILLFALTTGAAYLVATFGRFPPAQRTTAVFEVGVQNPPVAFFIAVNLIEDMALVPPAAVYAVVMVVVSFVLVPVLRPSNTLAQRRAAPPRPGARA